MKKIGTAMLLALLFMLSPALISAQDEGKTQAYWIHEDQVKLSMVPEYEKVSKELIDNLKKHNIQDEGWLTSSTTDGRYLYISPIKNMADLDRPLFTSLAEKMGGDALGELFGRMDKCYDRHLNYVIRLDKELSYMPDGMTLTPEGENYRRFHYLHYAPGDAAKIKEGMKAIKDMFVAKGSKMHYRVYKNGFGAQGDFYMVAIAAKDGVEYEKKGAENDVLFGEDGPKTFGGVFGNLLKYEDIPGRMRPDMAYTPQKTM